MSTESYYKILSPTGGCINGGKGTWHRNGKWMPAIDNIEPCVRGYHILKAEHLLEWLPNEDSSIWLVDWCGERIDHGDKLVVSQARLTKRLSWNTSNRYLFACDCAERVLSIFESEYPDDNRPRRAIEVTRRYVAGKASEVELAAARDAARTAWAAEREWQTQKLLEYLHGEKL